MLEERLLTCRVKYLLGYDSLRQQASAGLKLAVCLVWLSLSVLAFAFLFFLFPSGRVIGSYYVDEDILRGCFNFASMQVLR